MKDHILCGLHLIKIVLAMCQGLFYLKYTKYFNSYNNSISVIQLKMVYHMN